jgi:uncharacterized membrane protein YdjX (TVP38/TMEM64 family)
MNKDWLAKNKGWLLLVAVVAVAIAALMLLPVQEWLVMIRNWLTTLGHWALPAFVVIYILATLIGLPAAVLFLAAGTLFGFLKGVIVISIADTLGASACFLLGRTVARKRITKWIAKRPQFALLDEAVAKEGWKIIFLTRLSPIVPSNILNYGFSLTKVRFRHYFFFSWLGMLPVIFMYVYLGSIGANLMSGGGGKGQLTLQVGGLFATVGAAFYTTRLAKNTLSGNKNPRKKKSK